MWNLRSSDDRAFDRQSKGPGLDTQRSGSVPFFTEFFFKFWHGPGWGQVWRAVSWLETPNQARASSGRQVYQPSQFGQTLAWPFIAELTPGLTISTCVQGGFGLIKTALAWYE